MLTAVNDGPAVVVCNSCRLSRTRRDGVDGVRGGAQLLTILRAMQAGDARYAGIAVQEMACLFACADPVTVHLRAPGRIGYVLGRFAADEAAARAILDYAVHHAESADGEVAFGLWPDGVKGHFIVRVPPAGMVITVG